MLLVPGLPIFLAMVFISPVKGWLRRAEYRFLLILALSTLGAVYVFNPGIGMPRNWDLFSIAGVPLAVLCYFYALEYRRSVRSVLLISVPAIVLGILSLAPRVATQVVPDLGIAHFKNYLVLDKIRNRNARRLLVDYYERVGNAAAAQKEQARIELDFPEAFHNRKARELISQAEYTEAIAHLRQALEFNPLSYDAYGNLGVCYLKQGDLDSALVLLKIADGLNPYNASTLNNMGTAYLRKGEYARSEKLFLKSLRIDSTGQNAMVGLASVYLSLNQFDRSLDYVTKVYTLTEMPYDYFRQAGDAYLDKRAFRQAARAYDYAIKRGLDPTYVKDLQKNFP
jgi:tetratricopeptide (TPR) repeat protein